MHKKEENKEENKYLELEKKVFPIMQLQSLSSTSADGLLVSESLK